MTDQPGENVGLADLLLAKRNDILSLAVRYKAYNVRVFGSVARGNSRPDSDIDFLVDFRPDYSLADHIGLETALENLLGHKVEVAAAANLREELRDHIIQTAQPIAAFVVPMPFEGAFVKDENVYLKDIAERISYIESDTVTGKEAFLSTRMIQDAVTRNFEIIGEAVKRLKPETVQAHPQVNWSELAKFRDFLIHHYDRVEPERIWEYVVNDLPPLKRAIEMLLSKKTDDPG